MPAGRYFRGLTTFDLLGNLLPGTVLVTAIILLLPSNYTPSSVSSYFLIGVVAFSLGQFVQHHASYASGDRQTFEKTMDTVRGQELEDEDDQEGSENNSEDKDIDLYEVVVSGISHVFYSVTMPVLWWRLPSRGEALDDVILPNRVWKDLLETYDIDRGTNNYSVLFHMISSELDDMDSPSRATRFQAIRNFHRGMWISIWYILLYLLLFFLIRGLSTFCGSDRAGIVGSDPYVFRFWDPSWQILIFLFAFVAGFWYLTDNYEEEFIEYLFTDYVVDRKSDQSTVEVIGLGENK